MLTIVPLAAIVSLHHKLEFTVNKKSGHQNQSNNSHSALLTQVFSFRMRKRCNVILDLAKLERSGPIYRPWRSRWRHFRNISPTLHKCTQYRARFPLLNTPTWKLCLIIILAFKPLVQHTSTCKPCLIIILACYPLVLHTPTWKPCLIIILVCFPLVLDTPSPTWRSP